MTPVRFSPVLAICIASQAFALDPNVPGSVFVRVVDVGAGLCCVVKMPGPHYLIYDAGNYDDGGQSAIDAIKDLIDEGSEIDLLVLSHSDSDHLGAVDEICDAYKVKKVIRSGLQRTTATWQAADGAIQLERKTEKCLDINLRFFEFPPGATYRFGAVLADDGVRFPQAPVRLGPNRPIREAERREHRDPPALQGQVDPVLRGHGGPPQ